MLTHEIHHFPKLSCIVTQGLGDRQRRQPNLHCIFRYVHVHVWRLSPLVAPEVEPITANAPDCWHIPMLSRIRSKPETAGDYHQIAGLYNAADGKRLTLSQGETFTRLLSVRVTVP